MKEAVAAATESAMIPSAEFRRLEADLEEARAGFVFVVVYCLVAHQRGIVDFT